MTLTKAKKEAVVKIYTSKIKPQSITYLAAHLRTSIRTVERVLDEYKVKWRSKPKPINRNNTILNGIDLNLE